MTDLFKPTFLRMGVPLNKSRPPTSVRPPTSTGGTPTLSDIETYDNLSASGTTHPWTLPSSTQIGDGVLAFLSFQDSDLDAVPSGWTLLESATTVSSGGVGHYIYGKKITASDDLNDTWTSTTSGEIGATWIRIAANGSTITVADWLSDHLTSATTVDDPPSVSVVSPGQYLAFAVGLFNKGTPNPDAAGAAPTDYTTASYHAVSNAGVNGPKLYIASRTLDITTAEDPGAIGWSSTAGDRFFMLATVLIPADPADAEIQEGVVVLDDGSEIGTYKRLDFRSGTDITVTVAEDGSDSTEADITIAYSGGGGGGSTVPDWVADLATPDSAHGDDQEFTGTIGGTAVTPTGTATWTQDEGLLSVAFDSQSAGDHAVRLYALTPTAAPVTITTRAHMLTQRASNPMMGICFTDGTASTSNATAVGIYNGTGSSILGRWSGTLTNMTTNNLITATPYDLYNEWIFWRLIWSASNTFEFAISLDGISWTDWGNTGWATTLTPTHFGVFVSSWSQTFISTASFEYIRVTESDLSV